MTNEQETIADIVAEMRVGVKDCDGEYIQEFDDFADRIEEAAKRETHWDDSKTLKNALAENERLREVLGYCVRFIGDAAEPLGADCETVEMIGKARALLANKEGEAK